MEDHQERVTDQSEQALGPQPTSPSVGKIVHPQQPLLEEDSAVTKAEKIERHSTTDGDEERSLKRVKLEPSSDLEVQKEAPARIERQKGVTPIKEESVAFQQHPELQAHNVSDSLCMLLVVARARVPRRQMPMLSMGLATLSAPPIAEIRRGKQSQKVRISTATSVLQRMRLAYAKVALMRQNSLRLSVDLAMSVCTNMIYEST